MHKSSQDKGNNILRLIQIILLPLLLAVMIVMLILGLMKDMQPVLLTLAAVLAVAAIVDLILLISSGRKKGGKRVPGAIPDLSPASGSGYPATQRLTNRRAGILVGKLHGIGARSYQQDCLAELPLAGGEGRFAIVADGMGGLTDSGEVSQRVVEKSLELAAGITTVTEGNPLMRILNQVTEEINTMLGPERLYKSGSTMIAAVILGDRLQWISVGDSRLYLYREGYLNALNRDHDQLQDWMPEILAGSRNYKESEAHPDARKLTSFLGMGPLRYVDASLHSIRLLPGDRVLLMSDGVYGTVSENVIADILSKDRDVVHVAQDIGDVIKKAAMPHQDNYSLVILGIPAKK